jgi:hypothetical protein
MHSQVFVFLGAALTASINASAVPDLTNTTLVPRQDVAWEHSPIDPKTGQHVRLPPCPHWPVRTRANSTHVSVYFPLEKVLDLVDWALG